jgi:hypothetical protein
MSSRLLFAAGVFTALLACKKKTEDEKALEKYEAKGKPRVAALEKVGTAVKGVPPTSTDALKPAPYRYTAHGDGDNLAFLQAAALDNLAKPKFEQFELPNRLSVFQKNYYYNACSLMKTGKHHDGSAPFMAVDEPGLKALVAVQYVGVVRAHTFTAPEVVSEDEFKAGEVGGDVLVYDLESGAQLGAYRYTAKNAPNVKVDISKKTDDLIFDLGSEVTRIVVRRFAELAPGASIQTPDPTPTAIPK